MVVVNERVFDVFLKNFAGNLDDNSVKKNTLHEPIIAQYVRINPKQWNNFIALRVEFYGCQYGKCW